MPYKVLTPEEYKARFGPMESTASILRRMQQRFDETEARALRALDARMKAYDAEILAARKERAANRRSMTK